MSVNDRFKDAPWFKSNPDILIGGVGGIGSSTLYCLSKSVPGVYYVIDHDTIAEHNIGTQFFRKSDIGKKKADALQTVMREYGNSIIRTITTRIDEFCYLPIMIAAFDNMEARKFAFKLWKSKSDRRLFIDGRLRATFYEVYVVTPGREEQYEATLFNDADTDEGPCTFKQTAYFAMLIGARITQMVCNYLTNEAIGEEVCQLPFSVREIGDAVFMDINHAKVNYNELVSV